MIQIIRSMTGLANLYTIQYTLKFNFRQDTWGYETHGYLTFNAANGKVYTGWA